MTMPLVVGNWKMHGGPKVAIALAQQVADVVREQRPPVQVVLAPPFVSLLSVGTVIERSGIDLAGQNCHWQDSGAFTGEISPAMLRESGCGFIIVGHSERRQIFHETDDVVADKVAAVLRHGIRPILCVGETIEERKDGQTAAVITRQLDSALKAIGEDVIDSVEIAYEPVWAIGTGVNATAEQIDETHSRIRSFLTTRFDKAGEQSRILYGGSVKPENAEMIAQIGSVSGVLVGGASLIPESFLEIIQAFSTK